MDDATRFIGIFGDHQRRATFANRLRIRDGNFIADLKARVSDLAARDNRVRGSGWLMEFSPVQTDAQTERSLFHATLTSATQGERRLAFRVGREWVEIVGVAMESSVRTDRSNLDRALENAFRRAVLRWPPGTVDPAAVRMADA